MGDNIMDDTRKFINFQASNEIRKKLQYLARKTERSQSGVLRWLIDREYEKHSPTNGNDNK
jgi:predicted transcriptional regulator